MLFSSPGPDPVIRSTEFTPQRYTSVKIITLPLHCNSGQISFVFWLYLGYKTCCFWKCCESWLKPGKHQAWTDSKSATSQKMNYDCSVFYKVMTGIVRTNHSEYCWEADSPMCYVDVCMWADYTWLKMSLHSSWIWWKMTLSMAGTKMCPVCLVTGGNAWGFSSQSLAKYFPNYHDMEINWLLK